MAQTVINFKTDVKLKREAKKVLDEMGLNFSIVMNASLRKIVADRKIEFQAPEIPNARLRKSIAQAELKYKQGKTSGPFSSTEALRKHLESI